MKNKLKGQGYLNTTPVILNDSSLLEEGEFCSVERIYRKSEMFSFTGDNTLNSPDDVAYIFRSLNDSSIENVFCCLIKENSNPLILHLGMGNFYQSISNNPALQDAVHKIQPSRIYFVHNHPGGTLICSQRDMGVLETLQDMFHDIPIEGIIINLNSGKYGIFSKEIAKVMSMKTPPEEYPLDVYTFDKQVFTEDFCPENEKHISSSFDAAVFISTQRFGERKKTGIIILSRANAIRANIFSTHTALCNSSVKKLAEDIVNYINVFGGTHAIVYHSGKGIKVNTIKQLQKHVKRLSGNSYELMDFISELTPHSHKSANLDGILQEKQIRIQ